MISSGCHTTVATATTTAAAARTTTTATAATEATTTAAWATTGTAAATAKAASTGLLRTGFINGQIATIDVLAIQGGDSCLRFLVGTHFNKAEALGAAGFPIHDHLGRCHGSEIAEQLFKTALVDAVGQIAYVKLSTQLTRSIRERRPERGY